MKDFFWQIVFIGILLALFLVAIKIVFIRSEYVELDRRHPMVSQKNLYQEIVKEEKSFVIFVYAYNSVEWIEKNVRSILQQDYQNYRVLYVDDGSFEEAAPLVHTIAQKYKKRDRFTIIQNEKKKGILENYFQIIHDYCKDEEIVVILGGKDWFAHSEVLRTLNQVYQDPNIWLTYGQHVIYPTYEMGICRSLDHKKVKENGIRSHPWVFSHLKSFYAGLFKRIRLEDFIYQGCWLDRATDRAIMFPMLEMAQDHYAFIDKVLYIKNHEEQDRTIASEEDNIESMIRNWSPYHGLRDLWFSSEEESQIVDIVLFSFDRSMQLFACLESIERFVKGPFRIYVIYRTTNENFEKSYDCLKRKFPSVHFIRQPENPYENFKPIVMDRIFSKNNPAQYVMFGVDSNLVKEKVDLLQVIQMMRKTDAYGFYFRLGYNTMRWTHPNCLSLSPSIYVWELNRGEREWKFSNDLDMTLYRKSDIFNDFEQMAFKNPNNLKRLWAMRDHPGRRILGLCFDTTKTLHLSLHKNKIFLTPDDFYGFFKRGFKINIQNICDINNQTCHIDRELELTKRE